MRINFNRRHLIGAALAGVSMLATASAAFAVDVTIWCWDTNFNGAAMKEAAARYNAHGCPPRQ